MCLTESTELLPSCCEFHGMPEGCGQGRRCPVACDAPVKFPASRKSTTPVTQQQAQGMDDMLEFAENEHEH